MSRKEGTSTQLLNGGGSNAVTVARGEKIATEAIEGGKGQSPMSRDKKKNTTVKRECNLLQAGAKRICHF